MKRFLLLLILPAALLAGCVVAGSPASETDFPLRVSAIIPHDDSIEGEWVGYWTVIAESISAAGEELGIDVRVTMPRVNYDMDEIIDLIRRSTYARVDAIIVQGTDDPDHVAALSAARDAGIQVVLVDTDADLGFEHLYVGTDNRDAGRVLGRFAAETTGGTATIAVLTGGEGYSNVAERLQGLEDVVAAEPGMRIVDVAYDNYESLTVMTEYRRVLREHPEADTLICLEGTGGQTLSQILTPEQCPLAHLFVFDRNTDVFSALESGLIDGVLVQDQEQMGRLAVEEIQRYAAGEGYSAPVLHTPVDVITRREVIPDA